MSHAKSSGTNQVQLFTPELNKLLHERFNLEQDMRKSFSDGDFELFFQPQYDIARRTIVSYEALLRWNHPNCGRLSPDTFIGVAEETGLIEPLGDWIITEACKRLKQLQAAGNPALRVSVNVSAKQFANGTLGNRIAAILKRTGTSARALELELTESALFDDVPNGIEALQRLRKTGVGIAIDDFGTGYSSLTRLQQLPVTRVKIDRSFVQDIPDNHNNKAIVSAIISLAHDLNMDVVAEGVETHTQALFLSKAGCDYLQGYYVGKPQPYDRVTSSPQLRTAEVA